MDYKRGMIVKSAAGHDKGCFFVVLSFDEQYAIICDGRHRLLEKPKRKKWKHLFPTNKAVAESLMVSNRQIRKALASFQESLM